MKTSIRNLILSLIFISAPCFSQQVDISKLSDSDKVKVLAMKNVAVHEPTVATSTPPTPPVSTAQVAKQWAEIGQAVGAGVVGAAKELGVVANDFAKTDLGKITIAILIYKYMGQDLLNNFSGALRWVTAVSVLVFGMTFAWRLVRRAAYTAKIEYVPKKVLFGLWEYKSKKVTYERHGASDGRIRDLSDSEQLLYAAGFIIGVLSMLFFAFGR